MNISRIVTLVRRDYLMFIKSKWRWMEFFYFPITSLIMWGIFTLWTREFASVAGRVALVVNVFWSYAYVVQSTINLSINEDAWHGEIHHLFITGIGKWEYLFARIVFGVLVSFANLIIMILIMHFLFLNISSIVFPIILFCISTAFISVALAILITGLIFMLGRDFTWLAWSALQFFILLSFPLAPLEIFPYNIQTIAKVMPYGNLFQSIRNLVMYKPWVEYLRSSVLLGFVYLVISLFLYDFGFDFSRKTGKFAKMF
ncbi:MAG: hypothetical protein QXX38_01390 [Candidatus Aenigmatarchaeota archaeon]